MYFVSLLPLVGSLLSMFCYRYIHELDKLRLFSFTYLVVQLKNKSDEGISECFQVNMDILKSLFPCANLASPRPAALLPLPVVLFEITGVIMTCSLIK